MLEIDSVSIRFGTAPEAVSDTSFSVQDGDRLAVIGETGSGKSVLLQAALGLLRATAKVSGRIMLDGQDLLQCREREMNAIRGRRIAYIPQGSGNGLNPLYTVGHQMRETIRKHQKCTRSEAGDRAVALLESFGLENGQTLCRRYPFQLSGGMRQRVLIAMGIAAGADLVLADEPTSALDVTTQAQIIRQIVDIRNEYKVAVIIVTHNIGVASYVSNKIMVMQGGKVVEYGKREDVIGNPQHEYTKQLLRAVPIIGGKCYYA